jgi:transposase-like protein
MTKRTRLTVAGIGTALIVGGGAAYAAKQLESPQAESQAVIDDAAKQLGVTPSALSDALKQALKNRVDAAVAAGRLTKAEGDALKQRIDAGAVPFGFGRLGGHPHFGAFGLLADAASYLGLTGAELRAELDGGKTLADVAKAHGKSASGLVDALVGAETKRLDAAVSAGRLTKEQEQSILADLRQRLTDFVNGTLPHPRFGFRFRGGDDFLPHRDRFRPPLAWG